MRQISPENIKSAPEQLNQPRDSPEHLCNFAEQTSTPRIHDAHHNKFALFGFIINSLELSSTCVIALLKLFQYNLNILYIFINLLFNLLTKPFYNLGLTLISRLTVESCFLPRCAKMCQDFYKKHYCITILHYPSEKPILLNQCCFPNAFGVAKPVLLVLLNQ